MKCCTKKNVWSTVLYLAILFSTAHYSSSAGFSTASLFYKNMLGETKPQEENISVPPVPASPQNYTSSENAADQGDQSIISPVAEQKDAAELPQVESAPDDASLCTEEICAVQPSIQDNDSPSTDDASLCTEEICVVQPSIQDNDSPSTAPELSAEAPSEDNKEEAENIEDYDGPYAAELKDLVGQGWRLEVALQALFDHKGNKTAATLLLETREEEVLKENFESSVKKMVESGWDEDVARSALLTQWRKDEEKLLKAQGKLPPESSAKKDPDSKVTSSQQKPSTSPSEKKGPKEAKREDVIFEVTEANLHTIVLESPVPVLLDVYADWCAPCRQLTPMLEQAAVKAGGLFRLAKLNSEQQKSLSDTLKVTALPTIFGFNKGKIIDCFTGGLSGEELQSFLIGVVMGKAANRTLGEHDKTLDQLEKLQFKLTLYAGMASMGSLKRERLAMKIDQCLEGLQQETGSVKECWASVECMKKAVQNCIDKPDVEKFRHLPTSNAKIMGRILAFENATQLLHLVGYRMTEDESSLSLVHRNPAPLVIAEQRFAKWMALARKVAETKLEIPADIHDRIPDEPEEDGAEMPIKREVADGQARITIHKLDGSAIRKVYDASSTTLADIFDFARELEPRLATNEVELLAQYPPHAFDESNPPLQKTLAELGCSPGASFLLHETATKAREPSKSPFKGFLKKGASENPEASESEETDTESDIEEDEDVDADADADESSLSDDESLNSDDDDDGGNDGGDQDEVDSEEKVDKEENKSEIENVKPEKEAATEASEQQVKQPESTFAARAAAKKKQSRSATLFGVDDGIVEKKDPKKQEYYGGSGTVFYYPDNPSTVAQDPEISMDGLAKNDKDKSADNSADSDEA